MADIPVQLPDGTPGTIAPSDRKNLAPGSKILTPEEYDAAKAQVTGAQRPITLGEAAKEGGETWVAGQHAAMRGAFESFGVPLDSGIGALMGSGATDYLKHLDEEHPLVSGWMGAMGQARGDIGAGELTGGTAAAGRLGAVGRVLQGGVQNVVAASAHDINEASLGDRSVNGEALAASALGRFAVGGITAGLFEGGAAALERGIPKLAEVGVPALESGANRAVGREAGAVGDEAVAAGARIRGLNEGEVPGSSSELGDILAKEQARQRGAAATDYEGRLGELANQQTREAAELSARQEAARKTTYDNAGVSVAASDRAGTESVLDTAARGGEAVDAAEQAAMGRARAAHGEAFDATKAAIAADERAGGAGLQDAMAQVGQHVDATISKYGAARQAVSEERDRAVSVLSQLQKERAANAKELGKALEDSGLDFDAYHEAAVTRARAAGVRGEVTSHPIYTSSMDEFEKEVQGLSSPAAGAHIERLRSLETDLGKAEAQAQKHVGDIDKNIKALEAEADKAVRQAAKQADAHVKQFQAQAPKEATKAGDAAAAARARARDIEAQGKADVEAARGKGQAALEKAQKKAEADSAAANAEAEATRRKFESGASKESAALTKEHAKAEKAVPKASDKTDVDALVASHQGVVDRRAATPALSPTGAMGALLTAAHGHPMGAAGALLSSFAVGRAKAHGNLVAARTLRALSEHLSSVDVAIKNGAAGLFSEVGTGVAMAGERAIPKSEKRQPAFDDVAKAVIAARANPALVEAKVRAHLGPAASDAPDTYAATLDAAQRAQVFMQSILPPAPVDAHTLTPLLERPGIDETSQDTFMQAFGAIQDPLSLMADAKTGNLTEEKVEAVAAVQPALLKKMRLEVQSQIPTVKSPLDYEREMQIGMLLGQPTNEVQDPAFQASMRASYQNKAAQSQPVGSKPKPGDAKTTKNLQSTSESVERGDS